MPVIAALLVISVRSMTFVLSVMMLSVRLSVMPVFAVTSSVTLVTSVR